MYAQDANRGRLKKLSIMSVILLMLLATIPAPNDVVTGTSIITIGLNAGWNFEAMPESISASDLALKSNHITSIVRMTSDGYYVSYIPSIGVTDFLCEPNEGMYIYSEVDTNITFAVGTLDGYISGNLFVEGNTVLNKNLTVNGSMSVQGDFEVNNLNVTIDLTISGDLTINQDLVIGEDLTVNGNLSVGRNLTVGGLTVTNNITINGYLIVDNDILVNGNITVMKDAIIYGNLTASNFTVINLTISEDLTINGDLTVSGNATINGDLVVSGNITGLIFTVTADYIIYKDAANTVYAKNGDTGSIEFQSTDASYVIQSAIDALNLTGGKIFIRGGEFDLPNALFIEYRGDPAPTITIEGEGYIRTTTLKLTSPVVLPTFLSLKGSRFLQFRNLQFDVNKRANYGIRMERDASGAGAGDHILENVFVSNAVQVGILIYASENNFLNNVWVRYGNPVGMLVTSVPPVADPTVKGAIAVDTSGPHYSNGGTVCNYCKWGEPSTTTRAGLILYRAQFSAFGGLCMVRQDAEACIIIDETQNQCTFDGVWIDQGPDIGIRIGNYPSGMQAHSFLTITGLTVRQMNGSNIIDAKRMSGSTITGVTTSKIDGRIILGSTTRNNFISGFTVVPGISPGGDFLTIIDNGTGNIILQSNYVNSGVAVSVLNGAWIAHGLVTTPSIVILTPRSNVNVWVNGRNETHFQVGASAEPVTVDWYAKV